MNWKLILQLSMLGLFMGVATVFVIPSTIEPACWLLVFIISAYAIAHDGTGSPFLHGVLVGLANSVWVTSAHMLFFRAYLPRHPREVQMMAAMPLARHPRVLMLLTGPVVGLISGLVLGVFALAASRMLLSAARRATVPTKG